MNAAFVSSDCVGGLGGFLAVCMRPQRAGCEVRVGLKSGCVVSKNSGVLDDVQRTEQKRTVPLGRFLGRLLCTQAATCIVISLIFS